MVPNVLPQVLVVLAMPICLLLPVCAFLRVWRLSVRDVCDPRGDCDLCGASMHSAMAQSILKMF